MTCHDQSAIQELTSTLEQRERALRERDDELSRLRRDHARLAGMLWLKETQLADIHPTTRTVACAVDEPEQTSPLRSAPPVEPLNAQTCPYLASYTNRNVRSERPSGDHVCYAIGHTHWSYGAADMEAQKIVCMRKSVYRRCPRYREAMSRQSDSTNPARSGKKPWWQFWRSGS